jgi:hypothetical protein
MFPNAGLQKVNLVGQKSILVQNLEKYFFQ